MARRWQRLYYNMHASRLLACSQDSKSCECEDCFLPYVLSSTFAVRFQRNVKLNIHPMLAGRKQTHSERPDRPKVLIIEDEEELRDFVSRYLEEAGYEVLSAADGLEGLRMAREVAPSLILLDVMLPKVNGFTISRLLKFDENYKHIPIIMWTWKDEDHDRQMGMSAGADMYIPKPFSIGKLMEGIAALIGAPPNADFFGIPPANIPGLN